MMRLCKNVAEAPSGRGLSHLLGVFPGSQEGGESEVDGAGP